MCTDMTLRCCFLRWGVAGSLMLKVLWSLSWAGVVAGVMWLLSLRPGGWSA